MEQTANVRLQKSKPVKVTGTMTLIYFPIGPKETMADRENTALIEIERAVAKESRGTIQLHLEKA